MTQPTHASLRKRLWNLFRFLIALLWRALIGFLRALFFPPKPLKLKAIGYWAMNEAGRWELRIPAFSLNESPPRAR